MSLSEIVNVTITKDSAVPTRPGFGTALIAGYHTAFPNRVNEYTELAELVTEGFAVTDPVYLAAQALLSQENRPTSFKVGRLANAPTQTVVITVTEKNTTKYTVTINGTAFDFTSDANATADEITAGLETAINGGSEPVTATDNMDDTLTIAADVAGAMFTLELDDDAKEGLMARKDTTTDPGLAADLSAIDAEDDNWYGLVVVDAQSKAMITAAAAWAQARIKLYGAQTADTEVQSGAVSDDVMSTLAAATYTRTYILFHDKPHQYAEAAWMGLMFTKDPGSATWAHKTLSGVSTVKLSATARTQIQTKKGNDYTSVAGLGDTRYGITAGGEGEWIDTTRGTDWIRSELKTDLFALLKNNDKVPYTAGGLDMVASVVRGVIQRAIAAGFLANSPAATVTVPAIGDVSAPDKAARIVRDVNFTAPLAGAVHKLIVSGKLSV